MRATIVYELWRAVKEMSVARLASEGKSLLARASSTRGNDETVRRLFLVRSLIEQQKYATLVFEVRKKHLTIDTMAEALEKLGDTVLVQALVVHIGKPFETTIVHELFRCGQTSIIQWVTDTLPVLLATVERLTLVTPAHLLAQRAPHTADEKFIIRFFSKVEPQYLTKRDTSGYTPVHYLGVYGHEEAYAAVEMRLPQLCNERARDGATPASLTVARLKHELVGARVENKRLQQNDEAARDSSEDRFKQIQATVEQREKQVKQQEAHIKKLTDERSALHTEEQRLVRQASAQRVELDALRGECRQTQLDAQRSREAFKQAVEELEKSKRESEKMRTERDTLKGELTQNRVALEQNGNERERLAQQITDLRAARKAAESEISTSTDTANENALRRNKALLEQIVQLESQIDTLNDQCDAKDREKTMIAFDKERIDQRRVAIEQSLVRQGEEREALQGHVDEAQKRTLKLEEQLEATNAMFRTTERELEQSRRETEQMRVQQATIEHEYKQRLSELTSEREALHAELADVRSTARHTEEKARSDMATMQTEMLELSTCATRAQQRAAALQSELNNARVAAADELQRVRAETQRHIEALHTEAVIAKSRAVVPDKVVVDVAAQENELCLQLVEAEQRLNVQLQSLSNEAAESERVCNDLRAQMLAAEERAKELERSAQENFQAATEWERYTNEVQARHEQSVHELEAKLQGAEDMLRRTRKELEQERALAAATQKPVVESTAPVPIPATQPAPLELSTDPTTPRITITRTISRLPRQFSLRGSNKDNSTSPTATMSVSTDPTASESGAADIDIDENTQTIRRNAELNSKFFRDVFLMVRNGDHQQLMVLFNFGLNPNTRLIDRQGHGQTMLEVVVRAAAETHRATSMLGVEAERLFDQLIKTVPLIVQRGGDWEGVDEFVRENESSLPEKFCSVLKKRDDSSPFCKSLLENRASDAETHMATVENFNRVPSKHEKEGLTYLHIAVQNEMARLVQAMLLTGRVDVTAKDHNGRTALHLLLQKCTDAPTRLMIAQFLLAAGARPTEPCIYDKLINQCRERTETLGTGTDGAASMTTGKARKLSAIFGRRKVAEKGTTMADGLSKLMQDGERYGTPLAIAKSLGDAELVACMTSRRYLLPTIDEKQANESSTPLLQDYIIKCVTLHVAVEELLTSNRLKESDELYVLYRRYRNVFHCFNPNFGGGSGYETVRDTIYAAARIDKYNTDVDYEKNREQLLRQLITTDESVLAQIMSNSKRHLAAVDDDDTAKVAAVSANATPIWEVCQLLMQATKAVSEHWFDVSQMIEAPARAMYPRAALLALRHFVKNNRVAALEHMLNRRDKLFGAVDVNTIVDDKLQFSCIELAAHVGVAETFEWLMDRQRARIDQIGAHGRTLVSIASAAGQPIAVVAFDHFKFQNKISVEPHPNSAHYGILTTEMHNTVLHQCARQQRADLMRFCIDQVVYQLTKKNKHEHTPLKVAQDSYAFQRNSFRNEAHERAAQECIRLLTEKLESTGVIPRTVRAEVIKPPPAPLKPVAVGTPRLLDTIPAPSVPAPPRPLPPELRVAETVTIVHEPEVQVVVSELEFTTASADEIGEAMAEAVDVVADEIFTPRRRHRKHRTEEDGSGTGERRRHRKHKEQAV